MSKLETLKTLLAVNNDDENKYTNYGYCRGCKERIGQTCCETCPCELSPTDLVSVDENTIRKLLDTGLVVIDWYEGDLEFKGYDYYDRVFYLRMKSVDDKAPVYAGWGGKCVLLGENGCKLDFNQRPFYGRRTMCTNDDELSSRQESSFEWRIYYDLLYKIAKSYL